jgi:hypothetical protein
MTEPIDLDEIERIRAAVSPKWFTYFTGDAHDSPYWGQIVRVWTDDITHWAEGFCIVTEEPEADDHSEDRAYLVAAANALPALVAELRSLREVARAASVVVDDCVPLTGEDQPEPDDWLVLRVALAAWRKR